MDPAPQADPRAADLRDRWARARCAALRSLATDAPAADDERALLERAWAVDPEATLRRGFENSTKLGRSFANHHRADLTLGDLLGLLPLLGSPCFTRGLARVPGHAAARDHHAPCPGATAGAADLCAWWREAQLGLVGGLCSAVYYTRVQSGRAHGQCEELLHIDAQSPLRLAPLPPALAPELERARQKLQRISPATQVDVLGLTDGELLVRIDSPARGCGPDLGRVLQHALQRALPGVRVRDARPRSVLGDPT